MRLYPSLYSCPFLVYVLYTTISFGLTYRTYFSNYLSRVTLQRPYPRSCGMEINLSSEGIDPSPSPNSHFFSKKSYDDFKLSKYASMVVKHLQLDRPSRIQALSFQTLVNGTSCILADQTGSGKTLAYLLPIIERMYSSREKSSPTLSLNNRGDSIQSRKIIFPKVLIMAPTAELANQVSKVVKTISSVLRFRSLCLTSGTKNIQDEVDRLSSSVQDRDDPFISMDILIATPGRLFSTLKNGDVSLENTFAVVLDEADVLFLDESFPLQGIGSYLPTDKSNKPTQFIFVTATLPDITSKQILKEFPEAVTIRGPGLHRIPPTIEEVLVDCSLKNFSPKQLHDMSPRQYNDKVLENKRIQLLEALATNNHIERTLIFCNTIDSCRFVENNLVRSDRNSQVRKVLTYHSAIEPKARVDNLNEFTRKLLPQPVVLICTDRASRGIDFAAFNVDHVILFDFPQEPSEYVRRVGRTGRAGRFGKVTILVHGRQVPMVKSLLSASRQGKRIDPIPSMNALQSYSKSDDDD